MSKSLRSMKPEERKQAIDRRIRNKTGGLGYWAVMDAKKKMESK